MKITLISSDKSLGIDGVFYNGLDFSSVPTGIHAIQWDGVKGTIEYELDEDSNKPPSDVITALPDYIASIQPSWDAAAKELADKEAAFQLACAQVAALMQVHEEAVSIPSVAPTSQSTPT